MTTIRLATLSLMTMAVLGAAGLVGLAHTAQGTSSCPKLRISTVVPGPPSRRANFTVLISPSPTSATYAWSVSAGKIIRGQNKAMIFVEAPPGNVTAAVTIGGLPSACENTASATVEIR